MLNVQVKIPPVSAGSYDIKIGSGILSTLWQQLEKKFAGKKPFVITDKNVESAGHLKTLLGSENPPKYIIDPPGEISKHINTVTEIVETMEKAALGRDSIIIALCGGTVGDIAGFAAAIFKRGIGVIQIPTTTVSQADSAIGGKTGVDSTISKNAYGAFWNPSAVFIDTETLKSLDKKQFNAGLVESVKHALIADADYFKYLQDNIDPILARDAQTLEQLAFRNCSIKAGVVEEDPTEKNKRKILNYGHTIGHAVESASNFEILHGQAVAIGILGACSIEQQLGLGDEKRFQQIKDILNKLDIALKIPPGITIEKIVEILKHDKKAVNKQPLFVLLEKTGSVRYKDNNWAHPVPEDIVRKAIEALY